jgi:adenylate cyclase
MTRDTPGAPPESRRLCALMFTDMVAWSAMTQRNEALAVEVLEQQRRIVRAALPAHGGREIRPVGDGFFISFVSTLEAVRCAIAIQSAIAEHNRTAPEEQRFQIRIGIHAGDVMERDGDLIGDSVNIASRIEPLAEFGGVCVTRAVFEQIRNKIPEQMLLLERPELKNITTPVEVYRVVLPWGPTQGDRRRAAVKARAKRKGPMAALALAVLVALLGSLWLLHGRVDRRPATSAAPRVVRSVAVLPLKNLSGDPAQDFFAEGVTDSLTTDLSQIDALTVISHQSVLQYKGGTKGVPEIARELNVDAVLEGSVQKSGDKVMINAQLIQASTDTHLWSARYTNDARDMLSAQNQIVLAITEKVKGKLTPQKKTRLTSSRPVNPEAQKHYFLGQYQFGQGTESGFRHAIGEYEQAIQQDAHFAPAYAGIADAYTLLSSYFMPPREAMPKAETAARKALEIDPNLAEAHAALGYIDFFYHWDRAAGTRELLKALALKPSYSNAYLNYGLLLLSQGRVDESLEQLKKAQDLEPTSALISLQTEFALLVAGKYDQTIAQARHTLEIEPKLSWSHMQMGLAYLYRGDKEQALRELKTANDMESNSANATMYAFSLAISGNNKEAERVLNRFVEQSKGKYVCAYEVATAYEGMKDRTKALQWLRRGQEEKCDCLVWGGVEPMMEELRKDPRYQAILAESGLLHERAR